MGEQCKRSPPAPAGSGRLAGPWMLMYSLAFIGSTQVADDGKGAPCCRALVSCSAPTGFTRTLLLPYNVMALPDLCTGVGLSTALSVYLPGTSGMERSVDALTTPATCLKCSLDDSDVLYETCTCRSPGTEKLVLLR